jgi:myo-inositol-1(or 4)-monophosphatase
MTKSPLVNIMAQAAFKAAKSLIRDFGEVENLQVSRKGPADFVSNADNRSEKVIRQELEKARPSYGFLLEERGEIEGEDPDHQWIVDPLDGTTNFLHSIPHFAISIALKKKDKIIAGIVYDPIKDELFWAEHGGGAFANERRIRVSTRADIGDAIVAVEPPLRQHPQAENFFQAATQAAKLTSGVRTFGCASLNLAYVAAGRCEGYFEYGLKPWDVAAGLLLVQEAGGYTSGLEASHDPFTGESVLATNALLSETFQKNIIGQ